MNFSSAAATSDALMVLAVIAYVASVAVHAASLIASAPRRKVNESEAVTVGALRRTAAPGSTGVTTTGRATVPPPVGSEIRAWIARPGMPAALTITWLAVAVHAAAVVSRGAAADRVPWGNMYEFILTTTLAGGIGWLVITLRRPAMRPAGLFVTLGLALLLGGAGRVHVRVAPLVPALDSPWLKIHVVAAAGSAGLFLVGFVTACLYLARLRHDGATAAGRPATMTVGAMPSAERLDRLTWRLHATAFPLWTFAVICGAVWAEAAWGRYWAWDPKETWAFITWVLYAAYLHARNTAGWRGTRAAGIALAGWTSMMINLFAVNMLFPSLHSYAGL
jgi:cytochrome c-type biogenesis protein CcsB